MKPLLLSAACLLVLGCTASINDTPTSASNEVEYLPSSFVCVSVEGTPTAAMFTDTLLTSDTCATGGPLTVDGRLQFSGEVCKKDFVDKVKCCDTAALYHTWHWCETKGAIN